MRVILSLIASLLVCPLALLFAPAPTPAPTVTATLSAPPIPEPSLTLATRLPADQVHVGDTFAIDGVTHNIGLPIYTLTLSSSASAHVRYDNGEKTLVRNDDHFEIISMQAGMTGVTFAVRALAAGTVEATISATGEVQSKEGAYLWGGGSSPPLTLTVAE
jgi:hypothetical protein